jgi:hypothetical protein
LGPTGAPQAPSAEGGNAVSAAPATDAPAPTPALPLPTAAASAPTPQATPSLSTALSAIPAAVAAYAQDGHGHTSPYVIGADTLAVVSLASSLALALLRRRGLL